MHFTHLQLNPNRQATRRWVSSPQRLHAAVLGAFPPGRTGGRVLWRLDTDDHTALDLYLVSKATPSPEGILEQGGWSSTISWRSAAYEGLLERLKARQQWVFRLLANPTKSIRTDTKDRGKRIPLVRLDDQVKWLEARQEQCGFALTPGAHHDFNLKLSNRGSRRFTRHTGAQRRTVTIEMVQFDGVLEVRNPELLRQMLVSGIGSAKGYGCGLMTLAKLP